MKYFFVLGRNPLLSKAEIISYFLTNKISFNELLFRKNFLILEGDININIQDFGGLIKMGRITFSGNQDDYENFIANEDLTEKEKFTYCVHGNANPNIFSVKFKREGRKAVIRHGRKDLQLQRGHLTTIPNAEVEFFAYKDKEYYFGIVEQSYSYKDIKYRDMKKPFRREELAISPRLAKILINLSQVTEGELLLDPFCGIGTILLESLTRGINIYGVDKDKMAIEFAKRNINWLENNYKIEATWKLLNANSERIPNIKFNGVATEPQLGELQKSKPNNEKAIAIIQNFEKSIVKVLKRLREMKKENAKIVFTAPSIREFSVDIGKICRESGLKLYELSGVEFPIKEYKEGQFISRDIFILV